MKNKNAEQVPRMKIRLKPVFYLLISAIIDSIE